MKAKKSIIVVVLLILVLVAAIFVYKKRHQSGPVAQQANPSSAYTFNQIPQSASTTPTGVPTAAPSTFELNVPFTVQAPTGNWDQVHNEDCEEAVSVMANAYFSGDAREVIPPAEADSDMNTLNNWEQQNFGYYLDTTAQETAQMIAAVYHLTAITVPNFTEDQVKQDVAAGKIVIIPVNGQDIGNPYYKTPGPIYHMLLIRGFNGDTLITNDSGTRHGENYTYKFSTLQNAAADWDHSINTIDQSKKVMIVVSK